MPAQKNVVASIALLVITIGLFPGCNRSRVSNASAQNSQAASTGGDSQGTSSSAITAATRSDEPSGLNRCALLTDDEVQDAIGPHAAGVNAPGNGWGLQSCRWLSTSAQKEVADTGVAITSNWLEVGVFPPGGFGENAAWAREQAQGETVAGFIQGARYDANSGELWFECPHDRFCVLKAHTNRGKRNVGEKREQTALHLAELVEKRLR